MLCTPSDFFRNPLSSKENAFSLSPSPRRREQCRSAERAYLLEDVQALQAAYALPLSYQPARRRSRGATKCRKSLWARKVLLWEVWNASRSRCSVWCLWCLLGAEIGAIHAEQLIELQNARP